MEGVTMSSPILIAGALVSGFAVGFVPALVDSVRTALRPQYKGSEGRFDRVLDLFYVAWLPLMPLAGWLLDHWSAQSVLFLGLGACVLGIASVGVARTLTSLAGSAALLGAGYSWTAVAGIRLMADALRFAPNASHIGALNLGFVAVILGAVLAPWVTAFVQRRWDHRLGMLYLSLAPLAAAVLVLAAPRAEFPQPATSLAWGDAIGNVRLWLLAVVILGYFAVENCLEFWPEPYLKDIGYQGRGMTIALLLFWGAFTAARAAMGWLPESWADIWLLLGLVLASSCIMGNLVGANEYSSGSVGFWMTGACYGPLLPAFLALVIDWMPATALGMMLALSGLDTLIVRPVMTRLARRRPVRTVMRVPAILGLIIAAPLLVLALLR
jgi:MFS family permease